MPQLKISTGTMTQKVKESDTPNRPDVEQVTQKLERIQCLVAALMACIIVLILAFFIFNFTDIIQFSAEEDVLFMIPCENMDQKPKQSLRNSKSNDNGLPQTESSYSKESSENSKSDGMATGILSKDDELMTTDNGLPQTESAYPTESSANSKSDETDTGILSKDDELKNTNNGLLQTESAYPKHSPENSKSEGTDTGILSKDDELKTSNNGLLQTESPYSKESSDSDETYAGTPLESKNGTFDENDLRAWLSKVRLMFPVKPKPDVLISSEIEVFEDVVGKPCGHVSGPRTRDLGRVFVTVCLFIFIISISLNVSFLYLIWVHNCKGTSIMDTLFSV